ncbi:MAG: transcriptional repressor LexA [Thioalkalispiraceae bacterium]
MENISKLTTLENRMLQFIRGYLTQRGQGPTLTEIGAALGVNSKGTVHRYVQALVDKGYLHHTERGWRGIRLTEIPHSHTTLPLVGRIAAGRPIEAIPGEDELNFADFSGQDNFALEVQGDSMCEVGILDGDIVIIKSQATAKDGEIVVALIDDQEATLKRFRKLNDNKIKLIPENSQMQPMVYDAQRVQIQGVLVGQLRRY